MTQQQLQQEIRSGSFRPVYALYGEEAYLVCHFADAIAAGVCRDGMADFNRLSFDGQESPWDDIEQAARSMPLMAERKCVTVRNCDVGAAGDKILPLLQDPPADTVLVFLFTAVQPNAKSARWKAFLSACDKAGGTLECKHLEERELVRLLIKGAARRGCTMPERAAQALVERSGEDLLLLHNELDKLCAVVGRGGDVTVGIVERAASRTLDSSVFALSKALLQGQAERALGLLDTLLEQKEDPVAVLAVLANAYADLYRVKAAQTAAVPAAEVGKYYAYGGREFRLRNAAADVRRLPSGAAEKSLECLAAADRRLKMSRADNRIVLEQLLVQLARIARGEAV
ncbi:MAG: DNA polymerase III subunit delta [Clostridia bacterium]|nr:DNA polymerase III subunit delta [Clostridia bacterium]